MAGPRIRIKLRAYDHEVLDDAAREIVDHVVRTGAKERDGYDAIQLAYGASRRGRITKPVEGHFKAAGAKPAPHLVELRTEAAGTYEPGQQITVDIFQPGEHADVIGVSQGKGFAGPMKRHGFAGMG